MIQLRKMNSNNTAENALRFINSAIASGRTVYVSTMTKRTAISPATVARWNKAGNTLFKFLSDGSLAMAAGKSFGRIATKDTLLVDLRAA